MEECNIYLIDDKPAKHRLLKPLLAILAERRPSIVWRDGFKGNSSQAWLSAKQLANALCDENGCLLIDFNMRFREEPRRGQKIEAMLDEIGQRVGVSKDSLSEFFQQPYASDLVTNRIDNRLGAHLFGWARAKSRRYLIISAIGSYTQPLEAIGVPYHTFPDPDLTPRGYVHNLKGLAAAILRVHGDAADDELHELLEIQQRLETDKSKLAFDDARHTVIVKNDFPTESKIRLTPQQYAMYRLFAEARFRRLPGTGPEGMGDGYSSWIATKDFALWDGWPMTRFLELLNVVREAGEDDLAIGIRIRDAKNDSAQIQRIISPIIARLKKEIHAKVRPDTRQTVQIYYQNNPARHGLLLEHSRIELKNMPSSTFLSRRAISS